MTATALSRKDKPSGTMAAMPLAGRRLTSGGRGPGQDPDAARAVVFSVITCIESYLDEETAALNSTLAFDFKTSNDRKSQGLLDLSQALRRLQQSDVNDDLKLRLVGFREKLTVNLRKIRMHLDAVKEIASVLSEAIQNADSDGTYSRNIGPYGHAP